MPDVSIIVPHFNDLAGLSLCLDRLAVQNSPDLTFEIIVADNGSDVGIASIRSIVGDRAKVIEAPLRGAGPARNAGTNAAEGGILAFTDSDCIPDADWLSRGVEALQHTDIVGGRMIVSDDGIRPRDGAVVFEQAFAFDNESYVKRQSFTVTANLFVRAADFKRIGGFVTGKSEDVEWCQRAVGLGYKISYAPLAIVAHPPRPDWAALRKKWTRLTEEMFLLSLDANWGHLRWFIRCCAMPASIPLHGIALLIDGRFSSLEKRRGGITLVRQRLFRMRYGLMLLCKKASPSSSQGTSGA